MPGRKAALVRELFEDLGVLRDGDWDERHLCFSPQERLFLHGRWQEGIEPGTAATARDREQFAAFRRAHQGVPRRRASSPFPWSGRQAIAARPHLHGSDGCAHERFDSPYLHWYVNYACRDDYGALAADTSAWAGIHYFASREPEEKGPLTWPEGNGWIARALLAKLGRYVRTGAMVYRLTPRGPQAARAHAGDADYVADAVIFAAPTFLASYVVEGAPPVAADSSTRRGSPRI